MHITYSIELKINAKQFWMKFLEFLGGTRQKTTK